MSALSFQIVHGKHVVEGSVARLFRSPVQPAEIAKRLERAMETQQTISVRRVIVPNFLPGFSQPPGFRGLCADSRRDGARDVDYLAELAQERGFTMLEHPRVELRFGEQRGAPLDQVVAETVSASPDPAAAHTQIFQPAPAPAAQPRTRLLLNTPSGRHVIPLESTQLSVGRGLNSDIILEDTRVSRHHTQMRYRARRFWIQRPWLDQPVHSSMASRSKKKRCVTTTLLRWVGWSLPLKKPSSID